MFDNKIMALADKIESYIGEILVKKRMIKFGFLAILISLSAGTASASTYKAIFTNTMLKHNLLW